MFPDKLLVKQEITISNEKGNGIFVKTFSSKKEKHITLIIQSMNYYVKIP